MGVGRHPGRVASRVRRGPHLRGRERERERAREAGRERERESERERKRERECVCVCVRVREREGQRERGGGLLESVNSFAPEMPYAPNPTPQTKKQATLGAFHDQSAASHLTYIFIIIIYIYVYKYI